MTTFPLHKLPKGHLAHIHAIEPNQVFGEMDHHVSRRLADLGFSDGMPIQIIGTGLFGRGPYAIRLGHHAQFSLRQAEAEKIICRLPQEEATK
mgnify:CR=1 FL=1